MKTLGTFGNFLGNLNLGNKDHHGSIIAHCIKSFRQTSVPTMSDVLPTGRMGCLTGFAVEVSESLWLSDCCLIVTGRRLMTAGRSRGGSISVVIGRVKLMSDCIAAGLSESLSYCDDVWRRLVIGRFLGVAVVAARFGVNSISLTTETTYFVCPAISLQWKLYRVV